MCDASWLWQGWGATVIVCTMFASVLRLVALIAIASWIIVTRDWRTAEAHTVQHKPEQQDLTPSPWNNVHYPGTKNKRRSRASSANRESLSVPIASIDNRQHSFSHKYIFLVYSFILSAQILLAKYKTLTEKELKKWDKEAEQDKIRYEEEMKQYRTIWTSSFPTTSTGNLHV